MVQAELAMRMSDLGHGWHQTTVAKTERAERDPRYPELISLAEALAVPLAALLDAPGAHESPTAAEANAAISRLELEQHSLTLQANFLDRSIDDLEAQKKDLLTKIAQLKKEIAVARKVNKDVKQ